MKRVASYSLFWCGRDDHALLYVNGARAICRAHHTLFPDWEWRIYHDGTLHQCPKAKILFAYESAGLVTLVNMGAEHRICRAMAWRLQPVFEESVEITLCRDLDSLPTPKEAMAVRQFVESGAGMHCMSDHPQHGAPIMGGLCGFRGAILRNQTGLRSFAALTSGEGLDRHGDDQLMLMRKVWPVMQNSLCEHRFGGFDPSPRSVKSYTKPAVLDLPWVPTDVLNGGDKLIPFMGVPGFDYTVAEEFYNANAPAAVIDRIQRAEA
jgi:hypothetical protein